MILSWDGLKFTCVLSIGAVPIAHVFAFSEGQRDALFVSTVLLGFLV